MSETKRDWDPFIPIFRKHLKRRRSSASMSGRDNQNMDQLFAQMKQISNRYRQKRISNQNFEFSFENIDISVSSDDSIESEENENKSPNVNIESDDGFQSSHSLTDEHIFADNEESEELSPTLSGMPSTSASETIPPTPPTLRRSKRKRIPVMEGWRGQRPVYKRDSTGLTQILVAIEEGNQYNPPLRGRPKKKRKKTPKNKQIKDVFNLSIQNKKFKYNTENNSLDIKTLERMEWKPISRSKGVDITTTHRKSGQFAIGMIRIKGNALKTTSMTEDKQTYLTVIYGVLALKVEDNEEVVIKTCDSFELKPNTRYSLLNLRKDMSYISFTVLSNDS